MSDKVKDFMNKALDDNDDYWKLFSVVSDVNDALQKAVEYGFKEGHKDASQYIKSLEVALWYYANPKNWNVSDQGASNIIEDEDVEEVFGKAVGGKMARKILRKE